MLKNIFFALLIPLFLLGGCEYLDPDPEPEPEEPEIDNTAPVAFCRDTTIYLNKCTPDTINAQDIDNGSTDNIGIDTMWLDRYVFSCEDTGSVQQVTLSVIDTSDNYASCTAQVTVIDTTPTVDASGILDFELLTNFLGFDPEYILQEAPGELIIDSTSLGERFLLFAFNPTNIQMDVLLAMVYEFSGDRLNDIMMGDPYETNDMELTYQLSILADSGTWFNSSLHALRYYEGYTQVSEMFESAEEMWNFIAVEKISKYDIDITVSQWDNKASELMIGYLGGSDDFGATYVYPYEAKKSTSIHMRLDDIKNRIQ